MIRFYSIELFSLQMNNTKLRDIIELYTHNSMIRVDYSINRVQGPKQSGVLDSLTPNR